MPAQLDVPRAAAPAGPDEAPAPAGCGNKGVAADLSQAAAEAAPAAAAAAPAAAQPAFMPRGGSRGDGVAAVEDAAAYAAPTAEKPPVRGERGGSVAAVEDAADEPPVRSSGRFSCLYCITKGSGPTNYDMVRRGPRGDGRQFRLIGSH
eukprot:364604-Chlamydomonas_euryale.AAC.21